MSGNLRQRLAEGQRHALGLHLVGKERAEKDVNPQESGLPGELPGKIVVHELCALLCFLELWAGLRARPAHLGPAHIGTWAEKVSNGQQVSKAMLEHLGVRLIPA